MRPPSDAIVSLSIAACRASVAQCLVAWTST
jgi:hypothetical protein